MKSQLSPEAPVYIPPPLRNVTNTTPFQKRLSPSVKSTPTSKDPQCSRYSRKSVRQPSSVPNSPRPILGTNCGVPRPILGRRSEEDEDNAEDYMGKEFRCMTKTFAEMETKVGDFGDKNSPTSS